VLAGLRRFHRERGHAPLSTEEWNDATEARGSRRGTSRGSYPSTYAVLRYFRMFREAWAAARVLVDRRHEPWSELEDWYLREGAGQIPRTELARDLGRSAKPFTAASTTSGFTATSAGAGRCIESSELPRFLATDSRPTSSAAICRICGDRSASTSTPPTSSWYVRSTGCTRLANSRTQPDSPGDDDW
jgi:hypothetical protein